ALRAALLLCACRGADRVVGGGGRSGRCLRARLRLVRRASRLAGRAARYRRCGFVSEVVQVEPRRWADPVRGADRGCLVPELLRLIPRDDLALFAMHQRGEPRHTGAAAREEARAALAQGRAAAAALRWRLAAHRAEA